jgi:hypothetical protein
LLAGSLLGFEPKLLSYRQPVKVCVVGSPFSIYRDESVGIVPVPGMRLREDSLCGLVSVEFWISGDIPRRGTAMFGLLNNQRGLCSDATDHILANDRAQNFERN